MFHSSEDGRYMEGQEVPLGSLEIISIRYQREEVHGVATHFSTPIEENGLNDGVLGVWDSRVEMPLSELVEEASEREGVVWVCDLWEEAWEEAWEEPWEELWEASSGLGGRG